MISENQLPLSKMRTYMEGGGQILPALPPETGVRYRAKNREIKSTIMKLCCFLVAFLYFRLSLFGKK